MSWRPEGWRSNAVATHDVDPMRGDPKRGDPMRGDPKRAWRNIEARHLWHAARARLSMIEFGGLVFQEGDLSARVRAHV